MINKIAILGAGTDGLLAAHACKEAGIMPHVYSRKMKTKLGGAQYLDRAIPGISNPDKPETIILHQVIGDEVGYLRKVYGAHPLKVVLDSELGEIYDGMREPAWSLRRVYNQLWEAWEDFIQEQEITATFVATLLDSYDLIISTVPLMSVCSHRSGAYHNFHLRQTLIAPVRMETLVGDCVIWDGTPRRAWFRMSQIFGEVATEWPNGAPVPAMDRLMKITMPIATDCDCWPSVVKLGRYGAWDRKGDTSSVFGKVINVLQGAKV